MSSSHRCGEESAAHRYDLHDDGQEHAAPCSADGAHDFSGKVHLATTPEGLKVSVEATDNDVHAGTPGSPLKNRDAVVVYPEGPNGKAVEVAIGKTATGYKGSTTIPF